MIYLEKNTTNRFTLELKCLGVYSTQFYLFEFLHLQSNSTVYFKTDNISAFTNRYDEFELIDSDTAGTNLIPNDSIYIESTAINLKNGQYKYNIYISETDFVISDTPTVDAIIANGIKSTGKMVVDGIDTTIDPVYL